MTTFNRGKLRKLVEAGKVVMAGAYHYDDMTGASRVQGQAMPVAMKPDDWHDRKEGVCYLTEWDFKTKSGHAYESGNGIITLIVHGNCNYDLKILP
jgi:hypothetical protein